jgi:leucyl-tRNA synthetase
MNDVRPYEPAAIEAKWQERWEQSQAHEVADNLPREKCYYVLEMFPYPSGKLHMGHVRNYSIGDAVARYKRMRGFQVLHPMGWDSFGLPAEQAAIERGIHPKTWTYENISYMRSQLKRMGFSYAWSREFACSDPGYSAREQRIFLEFVEKGLVYRKSSLVNWSTGLNTVLANEQVINGMCWRTGKPVIQKELPQWFLRTTHYAEELLQGTNALAGSWPDAVLAQQRNWIGKSEGSEITFSIEGHPGKSITVFTTRPDTIFGVTFVSIAPEHALLDELVPASHKAQVEAFRIATRAVSEHDRIGEEAEKKGVFTGIHLINPINGTQVPLWAANFVLLEYGTGAVMAVPAHDTRDFAFAKQYALPIIEVITKDGKPTEDLSEAYTEPGVMINSRSFNGQESTAAKRAITQQLVSQGQGRATTTYRLRDWGISRQRYWGNPLPFVYGEESGVVPLKPQDLPVTLPFDVVFDGLGNPLEKHPTWATTTADGQPLTIKTAHGKEPGRRETDTMDTFIQSSWYFARYTCPDAAAPLDRARVDHWLPVDLYIGGIEHAVLHLLYARFFQKALCDIGYSSVREPFKRLLCQGMVCMESYSRELPDGKKQWYHPEEVDVVRDDKGKVVSATASTDGKPVVVGRVVKMSKSIRNTVDPQPLVAHYGADTARLFTLFAAPPELDLEWKESGVIGAHRFLKRLWTLCQEQKAQLQGVAPSADKAKDLAGADQTVVRKVHATIKRATHAMERDFSFNTTIAACMELANELKPEQLSAAVMKLGLTTLVRLLSPIVPHITHELWEDMGDGTTLVQAGWPSFDESQLETDDFEYPIQINGKVRGRVTLPSTLSGAALEQAALGSLEVKAATDGRVIKKLIAVPRKVINVVLG